jgi:hypothetical protein
VLLRHLQGRFVVRDETPVRRVLTCAVLVRDAR